MFYSPTLEEFHETDAPFDSENRLLVAPDLLNAGFSTEAVEHFVIDGCFCHLTKEQHAMLSASDEAQGLYNLGYQDGLRAALNILS